MPQQPVFFECATPFPLGSAALRAVTDDYCTNASAKWCKAVLYCAAGRDRTMLSPAELARSTSTVSNLFIIFEISLATRKERRSIRLPDQRDQESQNSDSALYGSLVEWQQSRIRMRIRRHKRLPEHVHQLSQSDRLLFKSLETYNRCECLLDWIRKLSNQKY
jgi:hypothetical protein